MLTRQNAELLVRNRLTLAILLGSPLLVVAMFVILFQPGAFEFADPSPNAMIMIIFWVAFGGFFFGLTYGLLQSAWSSRSFAENGSSACASVHMSCRRPRC